jgi:hypothetical protein
LRQAEVEILNQISMCLSKMKQPHPNNGSGIIGTIPNEGVFDKGHPCWQDISDPSVIQPPDAQYLRVYSFSQPDSPFAFELSQEI